MNKKLFCVLLVICGLLLGSLVLKNGKLLLLGMPFLAYLIVGTLQAPTRMALLASRTVEKPGAVPQEPVRVSLSITNKGHDLVNVALRDACLPPLQVPERQLFKRVYLHAGEVTDLSYIFKADRGVYQWDSVQAVASDAFGLFEVRKLCPAQGELVVRPASRNLDQIHLRPRFTLHTPGQIPVRLSGSSTDFLGIREYRTGDSLRRLNWRLAARHPHQLFSNEYEREEIADFGLILDARKLTDAGPVEEALFENSIQAAVSLSESLLKAGNRVALLVFGESMISLLPGYGKKQLKRIIWSLARAKLGANLSLGYLKYFPTRLFPSRSFLIVLSSLGSQDHETYARLRSYGYEILLVSPDPIHCMGQDLPATRSNDLALRAARLERAIELKRLMKLGVQVMDWKSTEPFESTLRRAEAYLSQRKNV